MKYWEIIADRLSAAGWSLGWVSAIDSKGQTIWIADAHRDDGKRFIVVVKTTPPIPPPGWVSVATTPLQKKGIPFLRQRHSPGIMPSPGTRSRRAALLRQT
jgi:hypothetical protein